MSLIICRILQEPMVLMIAILSMITELSIAIILCCSADRIDQLYPS